MSEIVLTDPTIMRPETRLCPRCGAKPARRTMSGGFGSQQYPICRDCGYEFHDETEETPCPTA